MSAASHPTSPHERDKAFATLVANELDLAFEPSDPVPEASTPLASSPPLDDIPVENVPPPVAVTDNPPMGYQRPDMLILDDIARQFAEDFDVEVEYVEVTCDEGTVTISGAVPRPADRMRLEAIASTTFGVVDVDVSGLAIERNIDAPDAAVLTESAMGTSHENLAVTAVNPSTEDDPAREVRGRSSFTERG